MQRTAERCAAVDERLAVALGVLQSEPGARTTVQHLAELARCSTDTVRRRPPVLAALVQLKRNRRKPAVAARSRNGEEEA